MGVPDVGAALAARAERPEEVAAEEAAPAGGGFLRSIFGFLVSVARHGCRLRRRTRPPLALGRRSPSCPTHLSLSQQPDADLGELDGGIAPR